MKWLQVPINLQSKIHSKVVENDSGLLTPKITRNSFSTEAPLQWPLGS